MCTHISKKQNNLNQNPSLHMGMDIRTHTQQVLCTTRRFSDCAWRGESLQGDSHTTYQTLLLQDLLASFQYINSFWSVTKGCAWASLD